MPHFVLLGLVLLYACTTAQEEPGQRPPIIDMHLHALPADWFGPPERSTVCPGIREFPGFDPQTEPSLGEFMSCPSLLRASGTDEELQRASLAALERYNIVKAAASGPPPVVKQWQAEASERIIPAFLFSLANKPDPEVLRGMFRAGEFAMLGEAVTQYEGYSPGDTEWEPYWTLAEELDIPVGIHMGLGPPGAAYLDTPAYRAGLSNPLLLEEVLVRHPKLRVYVMHAGWPMLDEMIHLLYSHPQVYADVAVINWVLPRKEFHLYLRRLVEAGFGKRLMFGSDQMVWPEAIGLAVEGIESADFLTEEQKRDIFYNNAARFLRLDRESPSPSR